MTPGGPMSWVLVVLALAALLTVMVVHANRIERRMVDAARQLLPAHVIDGAGHRFSGPVRGIEMTLRLCQTGGRPPQGGLWSEVLLPPVPGVLLDVRPQDLVEAHHVGQGRARDAVVGDAPFDEAFVVEMAPAGLAPRVFDTELRRRLLDLRPVFIRSGDGGVVRLVRRQWDEDRFAVLLETGALLAVRLREAVGAEAPATQVAEQAALQEVRAARVQWRVRGAALCAAALLALLVLRLLLR